LEQGRLGAEVHVLFEFALLKNGLSRGDLAPYSIFDTPLLQRAPERVKGKLPGKAAWRRLTVEA
jgi:hypothetical protein